MHRSFLNDAGLRDNGRLCGVGYAGGGASFAIFCGAVGLAWGDLQVVCQSLAGGRG